MFFFAATCLAMSIDPEQAPKQAKPAAAEFLAFQDVYGAEAAKTMLIDARSVKQNCGACHSPTPDSKDLVCPKGHGALNVSDYVRYNVAQDGEVRFHPYVATTLALAPTPADRLGLTLKPVGDGLRTHLKLAADAGLLVEDIAKDSVLADADVKKFDVVVAVDDVPAKEPKKAVDLLLARVKEDKELRMKLVREGKPLVAKLRLAPTLRARLFEDKKPAETRFRIGVSLAGVDETLRKHLKIPTGEGAVVTSVEAGGAAADANIKQHDILLRWNNESIAGSEQLINIIQKNGGAIAKITLFREGEKDVMNVTPKPAPPPAEVLQFRGDLMNSLILHPTEREHTVLGSLLIANAKTHLDAADGSLESDVAAALSQVKAAQGSLERLQAKLAAKKQSEKPKEKEKK